jgi:hypothetical protein
MERHTREDLTELFRLWLDPKEAQAAAEDVRGGEEMLKANPAPLPAPRMLEHIRLQMRSRSLHRRRMRHFLESVAAVAAIIAIAAGLSWHNLQRTDSGIGVVAMIPPALWDTDDITSDDVKLAYLNSEVDHLEAQVQAVEDDDSDTGSGALNDVEVELLQIDTDFWKG